MTTSILLAEAVPLISLSAIVILIVYAGILALVLIALIRFVKFLSSVPKEQKLLRFELGKLAEEVHQIREDLKAKE